MAKKIVRVVGHKNPDTDSICAAIAYANLKSHTDDTMEYIPMRAGSISAETAFVLDYFKADTPALLKDVGTQIKDIHIRRTEGVSSNLSMKKAWEMMKILNVVTLPVVNKKDKLEGLIVTGDIAKSYMDVYDNSILAKARTQYRNIVETLDGKIVAGNEHGYFVKGKVIVGAGTPDTIKGNVAEDDLVIISDREESQLICIEANCSCIIVTSGFDISKDVINAANAKDVVVISTPYDTFTTSRLINQSMPIKSFMTRENLIHFDLDDYVDDVRDTVSKIRHRDFPILDENQNYVGMFSRRNLMNARKKQVILVDHNETSQAVANIDEAEILEIIDHHRIGSLETICTQVDKSTALILAEIAQIDVEEFAKKMFEAGSNFANKTEEEILNQDFKIFHSGDYTFGVSQISALSRTELDKVQARVVPLLDKMQVEKQLDMLFVMLTDILNESTYLIYSGAEAASIAASAYNLPQSRDGIMLKGVVSRKKQLIPELINVINER